MAIRRYRDLLTGPTAKPHEVIFNLLQMSPSALSRRGYTWHIGNYSPLSQEFAYFRIGRETPAIRAQYDEDAKAFFDIDDNDAPYTHAIIDFKYQVVAICNKPRLNPSITSIANTLQMVLNENINLSDGRYSIRIEPIIDPEGLLEFIEVAYRIKSLTFEVSRRNNWDANRDVQKPLELIVEKFKSELASTTISGNDIDRNLADKTVRAVSAEGKKSSAKGIRFRGGRLVKKESRRRPLEIEIAAAQNQDDFFRRMQQLSTLTRDSYLRLRKGKE